MRAGFWVAMGALTLAGCAPVGRIDAPQVATLAGEASGEIPGEVTRLQAYAPVDEPGDAARKPASFASLFGAAPREPVSPHGATSATAYAAAPVHPAFPDGAPLPVARPDFGDRPRSAPQAAQPAASLESRSLAAFERRAAGVPDDDEDEPDIAPVPPGALSPFGPAPARVASAGLPGPFILQGALHTGARIGPSSNGLALVEPPRRWRAAYDSVNVNCFPAGLRAALDQIATHFGAAVLVTSGARDKGRRGSLHRACKAADIRVAGVSPADVAAYARTVPGLNGVGTYRWVSVTHIDVRDERFAWRW